MSTSYKIPRLPLNIDLETTAILKQLTLASRALAELKGVAKTIPNETILLNTLVLQEAKESSEIENIVTTQDDLFKTELDIKESKETAGRAAAKEVLRYREAVSYGFNAIRKNKILSATIIKKIQEELELNKAGFRSLPGTHLETNRGEIIYTPPQTKAEIEKYMANLELFINDSSVCSLDPLIKLAVIHHQFESIHPFYDGNGRTGRIISVLYLVLNNLLDLPILYLSRYITRHKEQYYVLLQNIRDHENDNQKDWEEWVVFMLKGIEETANKTVFLVHEIKILMDSYKVVLRDNFGAKYSHELLNNLFNHPYTKIEFIQNDLQVTRLTASKYLEKIVSSGLLRKVKMNRQNYYINGKLMDLLINQGKS